MSQISSTQHSMAQQVGAQRSCGWMDGLMPVDFPLFAFARVPLWPNKTVNTKLPKAHTHNTYI